MRFKYPLRGVITRRANGSTSLMYLIPLISGMGSIRNCYFPMDKQHHHAFFCVPLTLFVVFHHSAARQTEHSLFRYWISPSRHRFRRYLSRFLVTRSSEVMYLPDEQLHSHANSPVAVEFSDKPALPFAASSLPPIPRLTML